MDYFAPAPTTAATLARLAAEKPSTLACMRGSAWGGDGGALLRYLADALVTANYKAMADPAIREQMLSQGNEIGGGSSEQFAALIKSDAARWGQGVMTAEDPARIVTGRRIRSSLRHSRPPPRGTSARPAIRTAAACGRGRPRYRPPSAAPGERPSRPSSPWRSRSPRRH